MDILLEIHKPIFSLPLLLLLLHISAGCTMVARSMHRYRHAHHARRCPSARASDATNGRPYAIWSPALPIRREVGHHELEDPCLRHPKPHATLALGDEDLCLADGAP